FAAGRTNDPITTDQTDCCQELNHRFLLAGHLPGGGDWRRGIVVDLSRWQQALRAEISEGDRRMARRYGLPADALAGGAVASQASVSPAWTALRARPAGTPLEDVRFLLDHDRAVLDEIRRAARRPSAELRSSAELGVEELQAQLARLKGWVYPFRASCVAGLIEGDAATAFADLETMLRLGEAAGSQPVLPGALAKMSIIELSLSPLWQGLVEHQWPDAELAQIENRLRRVNPVADVRRSLPQPRAGEPPVHSGPDRPSRDGVWHSIYLARLDPDGPSARLQLSAAERALLDADADAAARALLDGMEQTIGKTVESQNGITLARTACALERYWLANRRYPETLDELVPGFLPKPPVDPANGGPLKYRREAPDRFVLYSVGVNGQDDGGRITASGYSGRTEPGDSVWRNHPAQSAVTDTPQR
ncbi:MAG: hypothetical protein KDM81_18435, partial [Verrucomicrobiae bacterium]|nr:hypothetical protein [Verrucomicrobiae bacterium]